MTLRMHETFLIFLYFLYRAFGMYLKTFFIFMQKAIHHYLKIIRVAISLSKKIKIAISLIDKGCPTSFFYYSSFTFINDIFFLNTRINCYKMRKLHVTYIHFCRQTNHVVSD